MNLWGEWAARGRWLGRRRGACGGSWALRTRAHDANGGGTTGIFRTRLHPFRRRPGTVGTVAFYGSYPVWRCVRRGGRCGRRTAGGNAEARRGVGQLRRAGGGRREAAARRLPNLGRRGLCQPWAYAFVRSLANHGAWHWAASGVRSVWRVRQQLARAATLHTTGQPGHTSIEEAMRPNVGGTWRPMEDRALVRQVRAVGKVWSVVVDCGELKGRSAASARQRYGRLGLRVKQASSSGAGTPVRVWGNTVTGTQHGRQSVATLGEGHELQAAEEAVGEEAAARRNDDAWQGIGELQMDLQAHQRQDMAATWAAAFRYPVFQRSDERRRQPGASTRMATFVRTWRLDEAASGETWLLCDMYRAEKIACKVVKVERAKQGLACGRAAVKAAVLLRWFSVAERDGLGMVFYPGSGPLPAIAGSKPRRLYAGGSHARAGGWIWAKEMARLIGDGCSGGNPQEAQWRCQHAALGEEQMCVVVGDGLHVPTARAVMAVAAQGIRKQQKRRRSGTGRAIRYAGIGGGARDGLFEALRVVAGEVEYCAATEVHRKRREVAAKIASISQTFGDGVTAAVSERYRGRKEEDMDCLTMTWPCVDVSMARHAMKRGRRKETWRERRRRAMRSMARAAVALRRHVTAMRPKVIVIEQAAGLSTHFREALRWFNSRLRGLPYKWSAKVVDASQYGAWCGRKRVIWMGEKRA